MSKYNFLCQYDPKILLFKWGLSVPLYIILNIKKYTEIITVEKKHEMIQNIMFKGLKKIRYKRGTHHLKKVDQNLDK